MLKTYSRKVSTLHAGTFTARVTVVQCPVCPEAPPFHSELLNTLVSPHCNFGHDVMVYAGEAVLRRNRTVAEAATELRARNVKVSESQVRDLVARFTVSLGVAQAEAAPRLREHLRAAGGYILHIDSTCKGGSDHLLSGIDELSGFVLLNVKAPTESGPQVADFLRRVTKRFGPPLAVSCDMSAGIRVAVAEVLPKTPVFICHFHFLRDLGRDLMDPDYAKIRAGLARHGPKAQLERLLRELRGEAKQEADAVANLLARLESNRAEHPMPEPVPHKALITGFVASILESQSDGDGCGFPFDRPHLSFLQQARSVFQAACSLRDCARLTADEHKLYTRLINVLRPVCSDAELARAADRLQTDAKVLDRLRIAMRIVAPNVADGLNDEGETVTPATIEREVRNFCEQLRDSQACEGRSRYSGMLEQIEKYSDRLFADPIQVQTPQGVRMIQPQRTNNILERFFRRLNRQGCKRTGCRPNARFINDMLPDAPLIANLDNPVYLKLLLGDCKTLAERLARVDR
ncbi:MAG: transposase, partial [Verrucomicrobiota bacterium]